MKKQNKQRKKNVVIKYFETGLKLRFDQLIK